MDEDEISDHYARVSLEEEKYGGFMYEDDSILNEEAAIQFFFLQ